MHKLAFVVAAAFAAGSAVAADQTPKAEREASKVDWLQECVATARQRDASLTEAAATTKCRNTTGNGSATRATLPGHSAPPPERPASPTPGERAAPAK